MAFLLLDFDTKYHKTLMESQAFISLGWILTVLLSQTGVFQKRFNEKEFCYLKVTSGGFPWEGRRQGRFGYKGYFHTLLQVKRKVTLCSVKST